MSGMACRPTPADRVAGICDTTIRLHVSHSAVARHVSPTGSRHGRRAQVRFVLNGAARHKLC